MGTMRRFEISAPLALAATLALTACEQPLAPAPQVPPQGAYPPGQAGQPYAPGGYVPGPYLPGGGQTTPPAYQPGPYLNPQAPQAQQAYPAPAQLPQYPSPAPQPPQAYTPQAAPQVLPPVPPAYAANDPINNVDLDYLRATAQSVLGELVAALPADRQAKVQGIPFVADTKVGDVNAYASCDESHMPRMTVTDGLLTIEANIAQFKATDELFGTHKLDAYLDVVGAGLKEHEPIPVPPQGFIDPGQHMDGRKVARQHQILEEQLAFVLGHELGHHYLGHTGCANGRSGNRAPTLLDVFEQGVRIGSKVVPVANQFNEADADNAGVDDLLAAGARRQGYRWNEEGAILTLGFFESLHNRHPEPGFMFLLNDHPRPALRLRLVQDEANRFRQSGGQWAQPMTMLP